MFGLSLIKWMRSLNLFNSSETTTDEWTTSIQRWTTRVYLLVLLCAIVILTTFTSITETTKTIVIHRPTSLNFEQLYVKHSSTLYCPCTRISIPYKNFVRVNTVLHPICSSDSFVSDDWITTVFRRLDYSRIWPMDVRKVLVAQWLLIRSFCLSSTLHLDDSISSFYSSNLITNEAQSPEYILSQAYASLDDIRRTSSARLVQTLTAIRQVTSSNLIVSGWNTDFVGVWVPQIDIVSGTTIKYYSHYYAKDGDQDWCICWLAKPCPIPLGIYNAAWEPPLDLTFHSYGAALYNLSETRADQNTTGLFGDCLPLDGLLLSSLACYFSSDCIAQLRTAMPHANLTLLNQTILQHFTVNSTMGDMIGELMVAEWKNETLFEQFYATCAPLSCTYSFSERKELIYVATTILGLIGGLTAALRVIIPIIIGFIMNRVFKRPGPIEQVSGRIS